ncbi:hypothetical protein AMTRI_Chr09g32640 [Amborella trichopoda]
MKTKTWLMAVLLWWLCYVCGAAKDHVVGGDSGWELGVDMEQWASQRLFYPGDNLIFMHGPDHNVVEVNEDAFNSCSTTHPHHHPHTEGTTLVPLTTPNTSRFFICSVSDHCSQGMRLSVRTLAGPTPKHSPRAPPSHLASPAHAKDDHPAASAPGGDHLAPPSPFGPDVNSPNPQQDLVYRDSSGPHPISPPHPDNTPNAMQDTADSVKSGTRKAPPPHFAPHNSPYRHQQPEEDLAKPTLGGTLTSPPHLDPSNSPNIQQDPMLSPRRNSEDRFPSPHPHPHPHPRPPQPRPPPTPTPHHHPPPPPPDYPSPDIPFPPVDPGLCPQNPHPNNGTRLVDVGGVLLSMWLLKTLLFSWHW